MPYTPSLPTWAAINNANFTSPTGLTDSASGQPVAAGGLNLGDYFDATNSVSNSSYRANGLLYEGRYRLVQVDSGATAANVRTGTVGYIKAGGMSGSIKTVLITNNGTGATAGTYIINATLGSGGGTGAVAQVTVGTNGLITAANVLNGGFGYSSVPTFSLTATGTTGGAIVAQLDSSVNIVTSADQVGVTAVAVRPIVFLNSITPGNYGFVQELGTATLLGSPTVGTAAIGNFVAPLAVGAGSNGTVTAGTTFTTTTLGQAIDLPIASGLYKVILNGPTVQD